MKVRIKNVKVPIRHGEMDVLAQRNLRLGMEEGTFLKIEYVYGFEKFNTRPYHNYETWAGGWRLTDTKNNIIVEREEFADLIEAWNEKVKEYQMGEFNEQQGTPDPQP